MIRITLATFCLVLLASCHKEEPHASVKKTKMDMKEFQEDLTVPTALWKAMEKIYRPMALDPGGKATENDAKEDGKNEEKKEGAEGAPREPLLKRKPSLDPFSFHIWLIEKTSGVLGGQNYDLAFPIGGGILDYRYFVPETRNGTFHFYVKFDVEIDPKDLHVYYLSNSKIRQVGDVSFGNGCGRYLDVTEYWKKQMTDGGFLLNTVALRHVSLTSGAFFFVTPYRGKLRMAHVTIRDSRHPDLTCPK